MLMKYLLKTLILATLCTIPLYAQINIDRFFKTAQQFEIKPMAACPEWAKHPEKDLFRVAWVSDFHLTTEPSHILVQKCLNLIRDKIKPNGVFITGDNCGVSPAYLQNISTKLNLSRRRQRYMKEYLEKELSTPYSIIPGDNWPQEFEKEFGSDQYSFDFGGFHFIFFSADCQDPTHEGCTTFHDSSLEWLINDIANNSSKPCIYISHEPVYPKTDLDAQNITLILNEYPQIIATFGGHLHLDLEFKQKTWTQFVCPALGRSHRPAFKLLHFQKENIVIESYEWQTKQALFKKVNKWQKIDIPKKLQRGIVSQPILGYNLKNAHALPPHAREIDGSLHKRAAELSANRMAFVLEFGFQNFLKNK